MPRQGRVAETSVFGPGPSLVSLSFDRCHVTYLDAAAAIRNCTAANLLLYDFTQAGQGTPWRSAAHWVKVKFLTTGGTSDKIYFALR
jgi:hypothetical protein